VSWVGQGMCRRLEVDPVLELRALIHGLHGVKRLRAREASEASEAMKQLQPLAVAMKMLRQQLAVWQLTVAMKMLKRLMQAATTCCLAISTAWSCRR